MGLTFQGSIDADGNYLYPPGFLPRSFPSITNSDPAVFCRQFLDSSTAHKYIMGINIYVDKLVRQIEGIDGLVDEALTPSKAFGLPVVGLDLIPPSALVLVASSGRPLTASRKLQTQNIRHLDYFRFFREMSGNLELTDIVFNEDFAELYKIHYLRFQKIYSLLDDNESRLLFLKLVAFRYSLDSSYLQGFKDRFQAQYFEPFVLAHCNNKSFVDIGCFDGLNSLRFASLCPDYHSIYAFEPDPDNLSACQNSLADLRDVHVFPCALSDVEGFSGFCSDGSRSSLDGSNDFCVSTQKLDACDLISPGLIKLDIEGAELEALEGARATIQEFRPCLAVAAYHSPLSFVEIPELVLSICPDYHIYIRHYGESIYETVMYFVPKKSFS